MKLPLSSLLLTFSFMAVTAQAAILSGPSGISATTSISGGFGFSNVSDIVDGIDLNTDVNPFNGFAATSGTTTGTIKLNFNTAYNINAFLIANDINVLAEGVRSCQLDFFAGPNQTGSLLFTTSTFNPISQVLAQTFSIPIVAGARSANLRILSSASRIEIREIAFSYTDIPEPSSALLGAIGVLGLAGRRRR